MKPAELFDKARVLCSEYAEKSSMSSARERVEDVQLFMDDENVCAEPGYTYTVAALGNWNKVVKRDEDWNETVDEAPSQLCKELDDLGVFTGWEDEWVVCGECGKLVRTTPDCYGWRPSYVELFGTHVCHTCVCTDRDRAAAYLESIEGEHSTCNTLSDLNLEDYGYSAVKTRLEHGMHYGQDASPEKIAKSLQDKDISRFLFQLDASGQFDITFSVWIHESERDLYSGLSDSDVNGESVAGRMDKALRGASAQQAELKKQQSETGGVIYTKVTTEGATTRLVSPEEFVNGIRD